MLKTRTRIRLYVTSFLLMLTPSLMVAQTATASHHPEEAPARNRDPLFLPQSARPSSSRPKASPDPAIAAALRDVSPARIRATIDKLVSFGTRLTISPADPQAVASGRGIGAAREWIKSE